MLRSMWRSRFLVLMTCTSGCPLSFTKLYLLVTIWSSHSRCIRSSHRGTHNDEVQPSWIGVGVQPVSEPVQSADILVLGGDVVVVLHSDALLLRSLDHCPGLRTFSLDTGMIMSQSPGSFCSTSMVSGGALITGFVSGSVTTKCRKYITQRFSHRS